MMTPVCITTQALSGNDRLTRHSFITRTPAGISISYLVHQFHIHTQFHALFTMSTPLLQQFPSLSSYPPSFLKDLLSSPELTEAFLFTLPEIQQLAAEVEKLGRENEDAASEYSWCRKLFEIVSNSSRT